MVAIWESLANLSLIVHVVAEVRYPTRERSSLSYCSPPSYNRNTDYHPPFLQIPVSYYNASRVEWSKTYSGWILQENNERILGKQNIQLNGFWYYPVIFWIGRIDLYWQPTLLDALSWISVTLVEVESLCHSHILMPMLQSLQNFIIHHRRYQ